jgi:adenylyltransferase/sulfurtransferase
MMAALEVQEALKLIHGLPVAAGSAHVFNGVTNQFYTTKLPFRADCLSHDPYPEATPVALSHSHTVVELFEAVASEIESPRTLALDRDLVTAIHCPRCDWRAEVWRPLTKVKMAEATCPQCGQQGRPELISTVEEGSTLATRRLADLGVPPYDIVRVDGVNGSGFFLLAADQNTVLLV